MDERGFIVACPHCGQHNRLPYQRLSHTPRCAKCQSPLDLPDTPAEVASEAAFDAVISQSSLPVLVDFWAPWCGPCKMVAPEISKAAAEGRGRWIVLKVNTDQIPSVAQRFRVNSIPLLAVFQNSRELRRQAGAIPAPAIRQLIEQATTGR